MKFLILIFSLITSAAYSQNVTNTIRGTVTDKESLEPLVGAKVIVLGSSPLLGGVTDFEGNFRIDSIPVGRQTIQVTYLGYETHVLPNIDLASKDIVLTIGMIESVNLMDQVEIRAEEKGETVNKMTSVSARAFSIEESNRYAGSRNDVARIAQNFAGVQGADDSRK